MFSSNPPKDEAVRLKDSPFAWFGKMMIAIEDGDFHRATEAQRELRRLGWTVDQTLPAQAKEGDHA